MSPRERADACSRAVRFRTDGMRVEMSSYGGGERAGGSVATLRLLSQRGEHDVVQRSRQTAVQLPRRVAPRPRTLTPVARVAVTRCTHHGVRGERGGSLEALPLG